MTKHIFRQVQESGQAAGAGSAGGGGHMGDVDPPVVSSVTVLDNWSERIPVTTAELEAIEIWLKPLLDEIFGAGDA